MAKKKAARKANTVSVSKLSAVVERAAKKIGPDNKVAFDRKLVVKPGIIYGYYIRNAKTSLDVARAAASDVTSQVSATSLGAAKIAPAIYDFDGRIIFGFFPIDFDHTIIK